MPLSLASVLVDRYINAESDESKFIQDLVEAIADIRQPLVQVVTTAMKEKNRRIELQVSSMAHWSDDGGKTVISKGFDVF